MLSLAGVAICDCGFRSECGQQVFSYEISQAISENYSPFQRFVRYALSDSHQPWGGRMALPRMKMSVVEELNVLASLIYRARKIIQASEEKSVTNDHREKLLPIIRAIGFLNRELLALVKLPAGPAKVQRPC